MVNDLLIHSGFRQNGQTFFFQNVSEAKALNQRPFNTISVYCYHTCDHAYETRYSGEPLGLLLRDLLLSARDIQFH